MKVLHVIASVDPRGGGPVAGVFASSAIWAKHGHERHILSLDAAGAPWVHESPVPTFAIGFKSTFNSRARRLLPWLRYGYTPGLVKWLRAHAADYDAIIVNGLWNYASYGSWRALRRTDVPYFVFTHGMLDPWFNRAYPVKFIFKTLFWQLLERKVLRDACGVLFTCEEEKLLASGSFSPFACKPHVVGYGTRDISGDAQRHLDAFYERIPAARGRKLILFLSRLHPKKGVDLLIRGFARSSALYAEYDLVIAGPDQVGIEPHLKRLAGTLGLSARIHWPGMLTSRAKWGAFQAAEFFVLPSHQENFGIAVAEAMASHKPVLITNKVNIWREVAADGAGHVVSDDANGVTEGLSYMCSLSPSRLTEMGSRARSCFLKRFDLENNAMDLLSTLSRLIGERESTYGSIVRSSSRANAKQFSQ